LHPTVVACIIWIPIPILYSLKLSYRLTHPTLNAFATSAIILVPILLTGLLFVFLTWGRPGRAIIEHAEASFARIDKRLKYGFAIWLVLSLIELAYSRGVPLLWVITGSSKTNFDYGIPSLHGLVVGLSMALAVTSLLLYLQTNRRRYLYLPAFATLSAILLVSRGTLLVLGVECAVVYLRMRRVGQKTVLRLVVTVVFSILAFGYLGDLRTGAEDFIRVAQPTESYPKWAPSGIFWTYVYLTTPLNNLMNTVDVRRPAYNILFPNTVATLLPSVLRLRLYGEQGSQDAVSGELEATSFNASTAFVEPYQDIGWAGVIAFSALMSALCTLNWYGGGFRNILFFAFFTQTLMLSTFYDLLLSLPVLCQLFFFYYFTMRDGDLSLY
jgi:hypothetical protein